MRARSAFVAAALAGLAFAAFAQARGVDTDVVRFKVKRQAPGKAVYSGKIRADKPKCVKNRRFEIDLEHGVRFIGKTDEDGKFIGFGPEPPHRIKLEIKRNPRKNCDAAHKTITYNPRVRDKSGP